MKIAITTLDLVLQVLPEIIEHYFAGEQFEPVFTAKKFTPQMRDMYWYMRRQYGVYGCANQVTSALVPWLSKGLGSGALEYMRYNGLIILPHSVPYEFVQRLIADGFYTWREEGAVRVRGIKPTQTDRMSRPFVDHRGVRISADAPVIYGFAGEKAHTMYFAGTYDSAKQYGYVR